MSNNLLNLRVQELEQENQVLREMNEKLQSLILQEDQRLFEVDSFAVKLEEWKSAFMEEREENIRLKEIMEEENIKYTKDVQELKSKIDTLNGCIGKTEPELIREFEEEKRGLKDVIKRQKDRILSNEQIIIKRAITIINECINRAEGKRTVYLDSMTARRILKDDIEESHRLGDVNNPSKAVMDVFEKVVRIGEKYTLGFSKLMRENLMCLKYEPSKCKRSPLGILNEINEALKVKVRLKLPKPREVASWAKNYLSREEDERKSVNELVEEYCPEIRENIPEYEGNKLSLKELFGKYSPG